MKKITAIMLVIVVCFTLCTLPSFADVNYDFSVCIDFLQTRAEPCTDASTLFDTPIEQLVATDAKSGATVYLEDSTAKYLFFEGWIATDLDYADTGSSIGISVDEGEITWYSEPDANLNSTNTGLSNALRTYVNITIMQGTHYVEVFAKIADEEEPVLVFDFEYESDFGEIPPATPTPEPTQEPVVTEVPATEIPATDAPATEVPATEAPVTDLTAEAEVENGSDAPLFIAIGAAVIIIAVIVVILIKKKG